MQSIRKSDHFDYNLYKSISKRNTYVKRSYGCTHCMPSYLKKFNFKCYKLYTNPKTTKTATDSARSRIKYL